MKSVKVKINKIDGKLDLKNNFIDFIFFYEDDSSVRELSKKYPLYDDVEEFVKNLIAEIKKDCRKRHETKSSDVFDNFIHVHLDEKELGDTEEKIIHAINKVKNNIRNFKSIKTADKYMDKYYDVSRIKIDLQSI